MAVLVERPDLVLISIQITTEPKNPCPPCPLCGGSRSVLTKTLENYAEPSPRSKNKEGYHLIAEAPHYGCANPDCCGLATVDSDALNEYWMGAVTGLEKRGGHRELVRSFRSSLRAARWAEKYRVRATNT